MQPGLGTLLSRVFALAITVAFAAIAKPAIAQSVLTYHGGADRSGLFVQPSLSWNRVRTIRPDGGFSGRFDGHLYAQPLY